MTTIQVLPYKGPDKQVTATHRAKNLEEHLLAFLAANNTEGFLSEDFGDYGDTSRFILDMSKQEYVTKHEISFMRLKLKEALPGFNDQQIGNIIARTLGYVVEDEMERKSQMVRARATLEGVHENVIYNARFQISLYRRKTVVRGKEKGPKGSVGRFRMAIIENSRITKEELDILKPSFRELFVGYALSPSLTLEQIKDGLNKLLLDENRRKKEGVGEGRATIMDAIFLVFGYPCSASAHRCFDKHGLIYNRRLTEHQKNLKEETHV